MIEHISRILNLTTDPDTTGLGNVVCPICAHFNTHTETPTEECPELPVDGRPYYKHGLVTIPMWSECGSKWDLCIGEHKGSCTMFISIKQLCPPVLRHI